MLGRSTVLRVALIVWMLFGLACTATALWTMRTHGHTWWKIALYNALVWSAWAPGTLVVAWLGRKFPPLSLRAVVLHVGAALGIGLVHHVWWMTMLVAIHPYDGMGLQTMFPALYRDVADHLFLEGTAYFAVLGLTYAIDRSMRAVQLEGSLAKARLTALELQLQPHFLFNTLHAIGGLVRQNRGGEAIEMIAGLSDLLRYSLDHAGQHLVTLAEEIAVVRRYLAIQAVRFSDRLVVEVDIPDELQAARVPPLLLQPLVENAIRHGVERVNHAATITLRARREGTILVVTIENSAAGLGQSEGVGITNTRARLEQLFPAQHTFTLASDRGRVTATIRLPA